VLKDLIKGYGKDTFVYGASKSKRHKKGVSSIQETLALLVKD